MACNHTIADFHLIAIANEARPIGGWLAALLQNSYSQETVRQEATHGIFRVLSQLELADSQACALIELSAVGYGPYGWHSSKEQHAQAGNKSFLMIAPGKCTTKLNKYYKCDFKMTNSWHVTKIYLPITGTNEDMLCKQLRVTAPACNHTGQDQVGKFRSKWSWIGWENGEDWHWQTGCWVVTLLLVASVLLLKSESWPGLPSERSLSCLEMHAAVLRVRIAPLPDVPRWPHQHVTMHRKGCLHSPAPSKNLI